MAYDFEKDKSAKSFELELDNDTIMTAFITTDEKADGTLPELDTGVYGGIGYGPMSPDFKFLNSGGGGSSENSFALKTLTINCAILESMTFKVRLPWYNDYEKYIGAAVYELRTPNDFIGGKTISNIVVPLIGTAFITMDDTTLKFSNASGGAIVNEYEPQNLYLEDDGSVTVERV